jgi:integrase
LRSWLDIRSTLGFGGSALFPSTRGGRCWGKVSQYGAAKAVLAAAGLPDNEGGSFRLRHTFALRQLRRGSPPEQVAQWLGLSDTTALARYQRMLVDAVMQA